jgi:TPR repeat protein
MKAITTLAGLALTGALAASAWAAPPADVDINAQVDLARSAESQRQWEQARAIYLRLAEAGSIHHYYRAATTYQLQYGPAVPPEYVRLLTRAAQGGDPYAMKDLGEAALTGLGMTKDTRLGFAWTKKAVEAYPEIALAKLLELAEDGLWQGPVTSDQWLEAQARQRGINFVNLIGYVYEEGFIDHQRTGDKAVVWYLKAAALGHPTAPMQLGQLYAMGDGNRLKASSRDAQIWLAVAALHSDGAYRPLATSLLATNQHPTLAYVLWMSSSGGQTPDAGTEEATGFKRISARHRRLGDQLLKCWANPTCKQPSLQAWLGQQFRHDLKIPQGIVHAYQGVWPKVP